MADITRKRGNEVCTGRTDFGGAYWTGTVALRPVSATGGGLRATSIDMVRMMMRSLDEVGIGKSNKKTTHEGWFSFGGAYWTRTSDPIDVNDVLYQLSQQTGVRPPGGETACIVYCIPKRFSTPILGKSQEHNPWRHPIG